MFSIKKQTLVMSLLTLAIATESFAAPAPLAPDLQEALHAIRADPRPKALVTWVGGVLGWSVVCGSVRSGSSGSGGVC